jgi:hypothetical protein
MAASTSPCAPVSARPNGFAADIMPACTNYPPKLDTLYATITQTAKADARKAKVYEAIH